MFMNHASWPDAIDQILDGDHVVMLASVTPAKGVVLAPLSNFGVRDRERGTVTVNSSVGAGRKLARIRRDPAVALAFHTRAHATHGRPEYVLVQGRATLSDPIPNYPSTMLEHWERMGPWSDLHPLWKRWLRVFALRVGIEVAAERVLVWSTLDATGEPEVYGAPLPGPPAPQRAPAKGTRPRIAHRRAARRAARLPHALLGWVGGDGLPFVVPVGVAGSDEGAILLETPQGLVPPGGRRAGFTAHWFSQGTVGQNQRVHTGWLEGPARYAPHTQFAYRFPSSRLLFQLVAGGATRLQVRRRG